jgi:hypothetical protein
MKPTAPALAAITLAAAMLLAACASSTPPNAAQAQAPTSPPPFMYFTSQRSAPTIAQCLSGRVSGLRKSVTGNVTELSAGGRPGNAAWLITLNPTDAGTVVKVLKSSSDDDSVSEPKMRFDIARCSV